MEPRLEKLIKAFEDNGWTVSGSIDIFEDWWFQDIIQIISKWRPIGTNLYLTLLTDPQILNKKIVWCIGISSVVPDGRHFQYIEQITLNDIKREYLNSLVNRVNSIVLKSE